ncbi:MAG: hypothetical protein ACRD2W_15790 [Acidimicrobiales bacterium]
MLFLDEPSWERSALEVVQPESHYITDPTGQARCTKGFWGRMDGGVVVGKAPQRADDMLGYLRSAPAPEGV